MWYINSIVRPDFVLQTDRTLSQLKNSGGMRLIEDKTKINAIVTYEESFERLYNQQVWYEDGLKNLLNAGVPVFNYKYIQLYIQLSEKNFDLDLETFIRTARLLNTNNNLIIELGNRASLYSIITYSYLNYLEAGKQDCLKLIDILENKINRQLKIWFNNFEKDLQLALEQKISLNPILNSFQETYHHNRNYLPSY